MVGLAGRGPHAEANGADDTSASLYERTGSVYIYPTHSDYLWDSASKVERNDTEFISG